MGKLTAILIVGTALLVGAGIWFAQTRGYYAPVEGAVTLTLAAPDGALTVLPAQNVEAIASHSSPLGFRACFQHLLDVSTLGTDITVEVRDAPAPTIAPDWFDCYDAGYVDELLTSGEAIAYTAYPNVAYGVDRIVALTGDGRGWAWHELNDCGRKAYDGTPVGDACPVRETFEPLIEGSL